MGRALIKIYFEPILNLQAHVRLNQLLKPDYSISMR
jgi:hypothetical protein